MPFSSPSRPISGPSESFVLVQRPGPRTLDGMIAAAAAMALADGRADLTEHRGLLQFLRRNDLLTVLGRTAAIHRFATELSRTAASPDPEADLVQRLQPLAGRGGAHLIAAAAACVAAADGDIRPEEVAMLRSLRATLGLVPTDLSDRR